MLGWIREIFQFTHDPEPPTPRQLTYARRIGIKNPEQYDRAKLSTLIDRVVTAHPEHEARRKQVVEQRERKKYPEGVYDASKQWDGLADEGQWIAIVYERGKDIKIALGRLSGSEIMKSGKLRITFEVAKAKYDRSIGMEIVDILDRVGKVPVDKIKWYELFDDLAIDDVQAFRTHERRALKAARRAKRSSIG